MGGVSSQLSHTHPTLHHLSCNHNFPKSKITQVPSLLKHLAILPCLTTTTSRLSFLLRTMMLATIMLLPLARRTRNDVAPATTMTGPPNGSPAKNASHARLEAYPKRTMLIRHTLRFPKTVVMECYSLVPMPSVTHQVGNSDTVLVSQTATFLDMHVSTLSLTINSFIALLLQFVVYLLPRETSFGATVTDW